MNALAGLTSFALGLGTMLSLQPRQGEDTKNGIGAKVFLRVGRRRCFHIHHWVLCLVVLAVSAWTAWASCGSFTAHVAVLVGLLLGVAASDLVYSDAFVFKVECPIRGKEESGHPAFSADV